MELQGIFIIRFQVVLYQEIPRTDQLLTHYCPQTLMMTFISMNLRDSVPSMDGHFHSYALQTWQTLGLCIQDEGTAFVVFFVGEYSDSALNAQGDMLKLC